MVAKEEKDIITQYVTVDQRGHSFLLTSIPAWALVKTSYVSIRGVHDEEGAVQRHLNGRRIASIKEFTTQVGLFPSSLVLNWMHPKKKLVRHRGNLRIPMVDRGAQVIDGQHRRAGIAAAIREEPNLSNFQVPVAIFEDLSTAQCADIFISINTEQKPVPKSLVYDLFNEASDYIVDFGIQRATDIARFLNEEDDSPYEQLIKFPGSRYERGGIALSTVVGAIKPLVEEKGDFEQIKVDRLYDQQYVLMNFFKCLSEPYGDSWFNTKNAFWYAAGFLGAVEFLRKRVIPYCTKLKSFKKTTIQKCIGLTPDNLVFQDEVKGTGGKNAVTYIYDRLNSAFNLEDEEDHEFEF